MPSDRIVVRARASTTSKNLDVEMPRDRLIVITGLSGSGKSSLAFDTIYGRGTASLRRVADRLRAPVPGPNGEPDVDQIDGSAPPSASTEGLEQNPRSTVGTVTEVYDYLRLLFARIGRMHCPICGREIARQTVEQIIDQLYELPDGTRLMLLAPLVRDRKGEHEKLLAGAKQGGFVRVRVDGELLDLDEEIVLDKKFKHSIEIVSTAWSCAAPMTTARLGPTPPGWPTRSRPPCASRTVRSSSTSPTMDRRGATGSTASATPVPSTGAASRSLRPATSASTRPTARARPAPGSAMPWPEWTPRC